jgi:hypothetical protein
LRTGMSKVGIPGSPVGLQARDATLAELLKPLGYATGQFEFSFVTGVTYNFVNQSTDYQNGLDWHLDWGASQFLSKQLFVGAVGYFYHQLTPDKGQPTFLGAFESKVIGIGPQIGYIFPVGDLQGFAGVKGYFEFAHDDRPDGWNLWVTLAFSPEAPKTTASPPLSRKF